MTVQKTSIFPAGRDTVFQKLLKPETLKYISEPYAAFDPVNDVPPLWTAGSTSSYRLRIFRVIPFGTHTIHIVRCSPDGVSSRERNGHVSKWDHDILLEPADADHTRYTDRVEIHAGWKTLFIWAWANVFYAHRQRRWIGLLQQDRSDAGDPIDGKS